MDQVKQKTDEAFAALKVNCTTPQELELLAIIEEKLPQYEQMREMIAAMDEISQK